MNPPDSSLKEVPMLSPAMLKYLGQSPAEGGSAWEIMQELQDAFEGIGASGDSQ